MDGINAQKANKLDSNLINCAGIIDGMLQGINQADNQQLQS